MALLRRGACCLTWVNRLHKTSVLHNSRIQGASFLHTLESPSRTLNRSIIPNIRSNLKDFMIQPILTGSKIHHAPAILPYLPSGRISIFDLPPLPKNSSFEMPTSKAFLNKLHILPDKIKVEEPSVITNIEKLAVRMIVIRRHKIKKHRRKKFYKKTRITYARIKQARKALKEKNLQLKLIDIMNEGRNFDPKQYAHNLLSAAYEKVELPPKHKKKQPWEF